MVSPGCILHSEVVPTNGVPKRTLSGFKIASDDLFIVNPGYVLHSVAIAMEGVPVTALCVHIHINAGMLFSAMHNDITGPVPPRFCVAMTPSRWYDLFKQAASRVITALLQVLMSLAIVVSAESFVAELASIRPY